MADVGVGLIRSCDLNDPVIVKVGASLAGLRGGQADDEVSGSSKLPSFTKTPRSPVATTCSVRHSSTLSATMTAKTIMPASTRSPATF